MCLLHPRGAKTHVSTLTHTQTSYSLPLDTDNRHTPCVPVSPCDPRRTGSCLKALTLSCWRSWRQGCICAHTPQVQCKSNLSLIHKGNQNTGSKGLLLYGSVYAGLTNSSSFLQFHFKNRTNAAFYV